MAVCRCKIASYFHLRADWAPSYMRGLTNTNRGTYDQGELGVSDDADVSNPTL